MRCSELLSDVESRLDSLIGRAKAATQGVSKEDLNRPPDAKTWSPAQVFEHMLLANSRYMPLLDRLLEGLPKDSSDPEIQNTWFGKIIIKSAGPSGNSMPPPPMVPGPGPFELDIIDRWVAQHEAIKGFLKRAQGVNLSAVKFRTPYMPLFKMNLADTFEIFASHAERHVAQIEERLGKR